MELLEEKSNGLLVLNIYGRLDTTNYGLLEEKLHTLIHNDEKNILIDCENLTYISSSGLRVLLIGLKSQNEKSGKLALCCLTENIKRVFEISGFENIFTIYKNMDEALEAF